MSARAFSRCSATAGSLPVERVEDPFELGVHRVGVGLVVDAVQQRFDPPPRRLRGRGHQVRGVVGATPLPAGAGQGRGDRAHQAGVCVAGHQPDPGQAAGAQVAEEGQPAGTVLAGGDLDAEDLAVPISVDASGDQGVHGHDPATFADLEDQGVGGDEREGSRVAQRSGAELLDVRIELAGHL